MKKLILKFLLGKGWEQRYKDAEGFARSQHNAATEKKNEEIAKHNEKNPMQFKQDVNDFDTAGLLSNKSKKDQFLNKYFNEKLSSKHWTGKTALRAIPFFLVIFLLFLTLPSIADYAMTFSDGKFLGGKKAALLYEKQNFARAEADYESAVEAEKKAQEQKAESKKRKEDAMANGQKIRDDVNNFLSSKGIECNSVLSEEECQLFLQPEE